MPGPERHMDEVNAARDEFDQAPETVPGRLQSGVRRQPWPCDRSTKSC